MMIELMKERAGADEADFTFIYTEMPDQERFRRIMTKYSPEELECNYNRIKTVKCIIEGRR
ncbi:MAG: hypothetical protein V8Q42_09085 [Anaerovoracaceae bacterium]